MGMMINLDVMMARRKMSLGELSERVGITMANLSILKTGKARAIRFSTLDAICRVTYSNTETTNENSLYDNCLGACSAVLCC